MNPTQNHFELFGLPQCFAVDGAALNARYRELQREVHPDRFATAPEAERRLSMQMATQVNEAYRTLKSPLARARYLLALLGIDAAAETSTAMPREFLIEQMEWRESLQAASEAGDTAKLAQFDAQLRTRMDAAFAGVAAALDRADGAAAAATVRQLMFLDRLREEIAAAQEKLET